MVGNSETWKGRQEAGALPHICTTIFLAMILALRAQLAFMAGIQQLAACSSCLVPVACISFLPRQEFRAWQLLTLFVRVTPSVEIIPFHSLYGVHGLLVVSCFFVSQ
jgi:hypothetical protein